MRLKGIFQEKGISFFTGGITIHGMVKVISVFKDPIMTLPLKMWLHMTGNLN